jgi:hypothetical protein
MFLVLLLAAIPAAASAGIQRGNFDRAPFYDGKVPGGLARVAHAPVGYRSDVGSLDPTPAKSPALAAMMDSLRAELGRLRPGLQLAFEAPASGSPDVYFGARRGGVGADGAILGPTEIDPREPRRMAFDVETPGKTWRERVSAAGPADAVLVIQLGFGELWVRQADWKGNKQIEIGTGRKVPVTWLTSLDDPVQVLQLTGALVSREGKLLRLGAEGIAARRTGMTASVLGAQEVFTEADLAPLAGESAWREALRALVEGLLRPGDPPR